MTVLITGATGLIGRSLAESYVTDRTPVIALSRNPVAAQAVLGPKVKVLEWNPATGKPPAAAFEGAETVFHLMGEPVGGRWTAEKKAQIIASRVTGAQMLADMVRGQPVRLVSASSFGIYPGEHGRIYDETAPLDSPATEIQTILQQWEAAAQSAAAGGTRVNIMRFGMVCSPQGYPKKLVRLFRRGLGFIAGSGEQIVPIVHIDDAVGMLRWAASGHAGDGVINCVSPNLPTFAQVARTIARCLNTPLRFKVPQWLARPILGGSADYFLLSYHLRPRIAIDRGYNFRMSDPDAIIARAVLEGQGLHPSA